jgi:26S proteasome regulatory subunit T2
LLGCLADYQKILCLTRIPFCLLLQVDLEKFVQSRDELSGADIKAVCTEAGMLALRERRMKVCQEDFVKAKEKALYRKKGNVPEGLYL